MGDGFPADVFSVATEQMLADDSHSVRIHIKLPRTYTPSTNTSAEVFELDEIVQEEVELDGQGILIHEVDRSSRPSYTMWVLHVHNPMHHDSIVVELDPAIVESLGIGSDVLARYLSSVINATMESKDEDRDEDEDEKFPPTPPKAVICHICDGQIQPWYFEKHSELCAITHKGESVVQERQDNLRDHRRMLEHLLDAMMDSQHLRDSPAMLVSNLGLGIGGSAVSSPRSPRNSSPLSWTSSQGSPMSSPLSPPTLHRFRSSSLNATRSSHIQLLESLLNMCDAALDISMPSIHDSDASDTDEDNTSDEPTSPQQMRLQSPNSENKLTLCIQWQRPSVDDPSLSQLAIDTEIRINAKVDAVLRMRNVILYAERIRQEVNVLIDEAIASCMEHVGLHHGQQLGEPVDDGEDVMTEDDNEIKTANVMSTPAVIPPSSEPSSPALTGSPKVESTSINPPEKLFPKYTHPSIVPPQPRKMSLKRQLHNLTGASSSIAPFADDSSVESHSSQSPTPRTFSPFYTDRRSQEDDGNESDRSSNNLQTNSGYFFPQRSSLGDIQSSSDHSHSSSAPVSRPTSGRSGSRGLYGSSPRRMPSPQRHRSPSRHISPSPLKPVAQRLSLFDISPISSPILHSTDPDISGRHHHRQSSTASEGLGRIPPLSPRMPSVSISSRPTAPSIRDFDVIKPISKGAFGSVYLTKKKLTGDYYAIKVLKKADMIAKNQVTNVRAERAILMAQGESPFLAKLFFTFQSKDYLYLVLEYCPGGDCAALIKTMGGIPETWARQYLAEVTYGLESLHRHGIIHR